MRIKFLERDERGLYVYEVDYSHPGDPADPVYPHPLTEENRCVVIRSDGDRCYIEEQENGMCHVHNPNGKYFHQHRLEPKRIRTVEPLIGDDSYLLLPEQQSLF